MTGPSRRTVLATVGTLAAGAGLAGQSLAIEREQTGTDGSAQTDGWSQFRATAARNGAVAADAAPDGEYAAASWTAETGETVFTGEVVAGDGAVYQPFVVSDRSFRGGVVAFDAETGAERWRRVAPSYSREDGWPTGVGRATHAPAVGDGRLYLTSEPGYEGVEYGGLHAVDTETGETAWAKTERAWRGPPLLGDDALYVDGAALDPQSGDVAWTTRDGYETRFVGLVDGTLYGMRFRTDAADELVAWNAADGSVQRTAEVDDDATFRDAAVAGDALYRSAGGVTDDGPNEVVSHDASDGRVRWRTRLTPEGEEAQAVLSAPAVADGTVYVHTAPSDSFDYGEGVLSTVYALDAADGEVRWTHDTSTALRGDPSAAGDTVYVGGHALPKKEAENPTMPRRYPTVHALAAADGSDRWSYLVRAESDDSVLTTETPALAGGRVYGGSYESTSTASDGAFALEASDVAPDASNLPLSSDAPVAAIATDPADAERTELDAGTTVGLDGSASTGDVETYEWDLDDTGSFETTGQTAEITLDFCGSLAVTLRVTGPDGARSTASVELATVEE
ncbi:MAG: PQQ-binding-like beta-propeller repeat protein [Haloferacaceae archaeon]